MQSLSNIPFIIDCCELGNVFLISLFYIQKSSCAKNEPSTHCYILNQSKVLTPIFYYTTLFNILLFQQVSTWHNCSIKNLSQYCELFILFDAFPFFLTTQKKSSNIFILLSTIFYVFCFERQKQSVAKFRKQAFGQSHIGFYIC